MVLDLLAADGLGGYLEAVVLVPEGKADDCLGKSVLTLDLLEPREVQGFPNLGRDFFRHQFYPALIEEVTLGVKHHHGVLREYLRVVRDLGKALKAGVCIKNVNEHENMRGIPCHISQLS